VHDEIRRIAGVPATTVTHSIFAARSPAWSGSRRFRPIPRRGRALLLRRGRYRNQAARISILLTGSALRSRHPSRCSTCAWEPQSNGLMTRLSQCKTARRRVTLRPSSISH